MWTFLYLLIHKSQSSLITGVVVPVLHVIWIYRNSSCSVFLLTLDVVRLLNFCQSGYFSFPRLPMKMSIFSHMYGPFLFPFLWNLLPDWLLDYFFFFMIWGNSLCILDTASPRNSLLASPLPIPLLCHIGFSHSNPSEILALYIYLYSLEGGSCGKGYRWMGWKQVLFPFLLECILCSAAVAAAAAKLQMLVVEVQNVLPYTDKL